MFRRKSALLLYAVFLGAQACSDPTEAKPVGRHLVDKIVFANSGNPASPSAIYSIGTDGSGLSILQIGRGGGCESLSPDGTAVVFISTNGFIATRIIDSSELHEFASQVTPVDGGWVCPQWSHDSKRIAFVRFNSKVKEPGESALYSINADGTDLKTLATGDNFLDINWSPRNDKLLLAVTHHTDGGNYDFGTYLVNADGTGSIRVAQSITGGTWSPDAKRIVFACGTDVGNTGRGSLCVANPDGSAAIFLTDSSAHATRSAWSFDGAHIAFYCNLLLCIINPDGTGLSVLTTRALLAGDLVWSADSKQLAYACSLQPVGPPTVCAINADGTNDRVLINLAGTNNSMSWSPSR